jgi:hypothetical protein
MSMIRWNPFPALPEGHDRRVRATIGGRWPRAGIIAALALCAGPALAAWEPADLDVLTQDFVEGVSGAFRVTPYAFKFLDPAECYGSKLGWCFGANAQGIYGYPEFATSTIGSGTRLKAGGALVTIMETPPTMRYFGVTPYIFSRYYDSLPGEPGRPGTVTVFESLTDTVNQLNVATTGSSSPGQSPFGQLSVFVMTADAVTYNSVVQHFVALGLPSTAINLLTLPINAVPLKMGTGPKADTFTLLVRATYPDSMAAMNDYLERTPVRVLALAPRASDPSSPLPTATSKEPATSPVESPDLASARDQLINQLLRARRFQYRATESIVSLRQTENFLCTQSGTPCYGDNPDALYSRDIESFEPKQRLDKILIVGIDHARAGKATYVSHSVDDLDYGVGVVGADDVWLRGSALIMGQVSGPDDPRYATYSQLYAFTIAYDCTGEPVCVRIPEPTLSNPVGIPFGTAFTVLGRYYLDPATQTRPGIGTVIPHRVFTLIRR